MSHHHLPQQDADTRAATRVDDLITFLTARLTEDLARIWHRDAQDPGRPRPGAAEQVAVIDDLLRTLSAGRLPTRFELRILLFGYGGHPDRDPRWAELLLNDRGM
jgi:hypothetical protein